MTTGLDDISSYISAFASATALAYSYSFFPRYNSLACSGARYPYTGARTGTINVSDAHRRNSLGGVQSAYSEYRYSSPRGICVCQKRANGDFDDSDEKRRRKSLSFASSLLRFSLSHSPTMSPLSAIATPVFGSIRYGHCVDPPVISESSPLRHDPFPHDRSSYTTSNSVSTSRTRRQN